MMQPITFPLTELTEPPETAQPIHYLLILQSRLAIKTGMIRIHPDDLERVQACHQIRCVYGWNPQCFTRDDKLPTLEQINELMQGMGLPCVVLDATVAREQTVWVPEKPA